MAKTVLPYTTVNDLTRRFILLQAERLAENGGTRINIIDLETELAHYCGLHRETISMIKRTRNQPSLPVASKIAEFFGVRVDDIFKLVPQEQYEYGTSKRVLPRCKFFDNEKGFVTC